MNGVKLADILFSLLCVCVCVFQTASSCVNPGGKIPVVVDPVGQEVDQRKLGERLWKKTVEHVD